MSEEHILTRVFWGSLSALSEGRGFGRPPLPPSHVRQEHMKTAVFLVSRTLRSQDLALIFIYFIMIFKLIHLFLRDRELGKGRAKGRENPKQALCCQLRARCEARTPEPRDDGPTGHSGRKQAAALEGGHAQGAKMSLRALAMPHCRGSECLAGSFGKKGWGGAMGSGHRMGWGDGLRAPCATT